jgi:hypothetical protein
MQLLALLRLAFATAPCLRHLTLLHTITHRLIMQKARRQPTEVSLRLLVSVWFQVLFHSPPGVLFPHGTGSLSVIVGYLALADGPARFPQDFTCPAVLGNTVGRLNHFAYGALTLYGRTFQTARLWINFVTSWDDYGHP